MSGRYCLIRVVRVATVAAAFHGLMLAGVTARAQEPSLKQIKSDLAAVQKVIDSRFASEKELGNALASLEKQFQITQKMSEFGEANTVRNKELIEVQNQILTALTKVRTRLPDDSASSGGHTLGQRTGFGVPQFDETKLVGQLAAELHQAQIALRDHILKQPTPNGETHELLRKLILAEENLAWEVGWPFSAIEIAELKKLDKEDALPDDIYLARRERGVRRINEHFKASFESVGRQPPRPFVIHNLADEKEQKPLADELAKRRAGVKNWAKGAVAFDARERRALLGLPEPEDTAASAETPADEPVNPDKPPAVRDWTDISGDFKVRAAFVSRAGDKIKLKKSDGEVVEVDLKQLSKTDQTYIKDLGSR